MPPEGAAAGQGARWAPRAGMASLTEPFKNKLVLEEASGHHSTWCPCLVSSPAVIQACPELPNVTSLGLLHFSLCLFCCFYCFSISFKMRYELSCAVSLFPLQPQGGNACL